MRTEIAEAVVDASALVEWLLPGPRHEDVRELFENNRNFLLAPDLIFPETANAFRKAWRAGLLSDGDLAVALDDLGAVDVTAISSSVLLPLLEPLMEELTAYDALYVALALARELPLATFDQHLAAAAEQLAVRVIPEP